MKWGDAEMGRWGGEEIRIRKMIRNFQKVDLSQGNLSGLGLNSTQEWRKNNGWED
jgi:hypothetical protein